MSEFRPPVDYSKNKLDRPNDRIDDDNFRRGWNAGASALLEELRGQGTVEGESEWDVTLGKYHLATEIISDKPIKGSLVFIPDDKEGKC